MQHNDRLPDAKVFESSKTQKPFQLIKKFRKTWFYLRIH